MDLYAKRARVERDPCKPDGPEMIEFCKGFEHQPTKDQVWATYLSISLYLSLFAYEIVSFDLGIGSLPRSNIFMRRAGYNYP